MSTPVARPSSRLLPRASVVVGAAVLVLSGCAEAPPVVTGGGTVAPLTAFPSGAGPSTTSSPSAGASTATGTATGTAKPAPWPTKVVAVGKTLTDPVLGHKVEVKSILRGLPWPAGYTATSQAYELVAVQMTWTPSKTYTAPLRRLDFSVRTGAPFPSRPISLVDTALASHRLRPLPSQVNNGKSDTGWLVFKVDPRSAPNLSLVYTRPKAQVSNGGQVIDSKAFAVVMSGSAVPIG